MQALATSSTRLAGCQVLHRTDSLSTYWLVANAGSRRSSRLCLMARQIWPVCWGANISADIEARLDAFLLNDKAASTVRSYACQQRQYALFCQQLSVPDVLRFEPRTQAQSIMGRAVHGYKLSTGELGVHTVWRSMEVRQAVGCC